MFSKSYNTELKTYYNNVDDFNRYPNDIMAEYKQSVEEGLDIEMHKELFESVSKMENGATVGSILGMRGGIACINEYWKKPVNNKIHTSIFGVGTVDIEKAAEKTLEHIG